MRVLFLWSVACTYIGLSGHIPDVGDKPGESLFSCPPRAQSDQAIAMVIRNATKHREPLFLPTFHYQPPLNKTQRVESAVIVLHGALRDGFNYWDWVTDVVKYVEREHNASNKTMAPTAVFAPVFADKECSATDWTGRHSAKGQAVLWSQGIRQWMFGQKSDMFGRSNRITSFEALDLFIVAVSKMYPHLERIVITGFSSGSQMALRWAATSSQGVNGKTSDGVNFTISLSSPSDYIYLNDRRPSRNCSWQNTTSTTENCTEFSRPSHGNNTTAMSCHHTWDHYPWGLTCLQNNKNETRTNDSQCKVVGKYAKDSVGWYRRRRSKLDESFRAGATMRGSVASAMGKKKRSLKQELATRFATKHLRFAVGDQDQNDCSTHACASNCGAMGQGSNRMQRAFNFQGHLRDAFPGNNYLFQTFDGGHVPEKFFYSDVFIETIDHEYNGGLFVCLRHDLNCFSWLVKLLLGITLGVVFLCAAIVYCCCKRMRRRKLESVDSNTATPILNVMN